MAEKFFWKREGIGGMHSHMLKHTRTHTHTHTHISLPLPPAPSPSLSRKPRCIPYVNFLDEHQEKYKKCLPFVTADAKPGCKFARNGSEGVWERERECWRRPNSLGINAYLSRYGKQHLNDNECLRAALKDLSYSASSQFATPLWHCRFHLVYPPGGRFNRHFVASVNRRRCTLYKSSGQGPGAVHL